MSPFPPIRRPLLPAAAVLAAWAGLLAGCEIAGGGTDVGNPEFVRVTGSLRSQDPAHSPVADFPLRLRPRNHWETPDSPAAAPGGPSQDRRTDSQGFFAFDSVPRGQYRIEGTDSSGQGALIEVEVDGKSSRIALEPVLLARSGSIAGTINYLGPSTRLYPKIAIAARGTDHATYATSDGSFVLSDLPPGTYSLHISTASDSMATDVQSIQVLAGMRSQAGTVVLGP
jgi:hypothetical protein